jgi:rod shape-determining protein MreC
MPYRRETTTERKIVVLVAVLFVNLVMMSTSIVLKNERSLLHNIIGLVASPFQIGFQKTVDFVSHQLRHYVFVKNMFREYHDLKEKYSRLKYENYLMKREMIRLNFLREAEMKPSAFIPAELIAVDNNFPFNAVTINKGSVDGITTAMVILNREGELVGKVTEPVTLFTSRVRLITSRAGGLGAYIKKNKLEGFLKGNNEKICEFRYLIENAPVNVDDEVVTSGTDQIFPPYIPIGRVVGIEGEYLTQKVFVKPFFVERPIKQLLVIRK